ncbi:hypothetical protein DdX_16345 [Ditylenchus destructor]|uniref:Uncharacterized protein n=1 Tax=Ditylenchus destructor TaxID=166010 RepID=A0AAD4MPS0_9BILA|nr:hypothetical protein DdX_16345 [Ditylenchus destructor]
MLVGNFMTIDGQQTILIHIKMLRNVGQTAKRTQACACAKRVSGPPEVPSVVPPAIPSVPSLNVTLPPLPTGVP